MGERSKLSPFQARDFTTTKAEMFLNSYFGIFIKIGCVSDTHLCGFVNRMPPASFAAEASPNYLESKCTRILLAAGLLLNRPAEKRPRYSCSRSIRGGDRMEREGKVTGGRKRKGEV